MPLSKLSRALVLELSPAIAGVSAIALVSRWEPVHPGTLPSAAELWILLPLMPIFFVAGLGWFSLGSTFGAVLLSFARSVVALIMIVAVAGAHLYGCDLEPQQACQPSGDEMEVYRFSAVLNIAIPILSAGSIALWGLLSWREQTTVDRAVDEP